MFGIPSSVGIVSVFGIPPRNKEHDFPRKYDMQIDLQVGARVGTMDVVMCSIHGKTWANHSGKDKRSARTVCCGNKIEVPEHDISRGGSRMSRHTRHVTRKPIWKEARVVDGSFCIPCWGSGVRAKILPTGMVVEVQCTICSGSGRSTK